jgi:hypothetical protein
MWEIFSESLLIAFLTRFLLTVFDKTFFEPIAILFGQKVSVELLAKGYEALDSVMGDLMETYKGEELREQIRSRLSRATGTKWSGEMTNEFLRKFDPVAASNRIHSLSEAAKDG